MGAAGVPVGAPGNAGVLVGAAGDADMPMGLSAEGRADGERASQTPRLVALGELLVDFTQAGTGSAGAQAGADSAGTTLFARHAGGAPANVAVAARRLGVPGAFIGKVGRDLHGDYLRETLEDEGLDLRGLSADDATFTTMSFVQVDAATGERSFAFARKPGADTRLSPEDVRSCAGLIAAAEILHIGSLTLTDEPARSAQEEAVALARQAGTAVSYDPNWRPALWPDAKEALGLMRAAACQADLMKAGLDEARLLLGSGGLACEEAGGGLPKNKGLTCEEARPFPGNRELSYKEAAAGLLAFAPRLRLVAITMGDEGAYLATRQARARVAAFPAQALDTTGAGDAFWGALLAWLLKLPSVDGGGAARAGCPDRPGIPVRPGGQGLLAAVDSLTERDLAACGAFACAAASLSVERPGGIPSMPTDREVAARVRGGR